MGAIIVFSMLSSCIEPFEVEIRETENILVVEATITDKVQEQKVFLKRVSNLQEVNLPPEDYNPSVPFRPPEDLTNYENNATVIIVDDLGNQFEFSESEQGTYVSEISFAASPNRQYQLQINTVNNESYQSNFMSPIGTSEIQKVYAERTFNANNEEGIAIYVDGSDISNSSNYFRYTYEETYKIIAPNWTPVEFEVIRETQQIVPDGTTLFPAVELVPRKQEEQVCYQTVNSNNIDLVTTILLDQPIVKKEEVRFINRNNPIISHRYSILVKQHIQNIESYNYYQTLRNFSKNESVFSEVQPGFLEGNIDPIRGADTVIGYFDVASVTEKRLFFNYEDFFLGEELPPYFFDFNCNRLLSPCLGDPNLDGPKEPGCPQSLIPRIKLGLVEYVGVNTVPNVCEGPYFVTPRICGDCTVLGSNIKPDFWID